MFTIFFAVETDLSVIVIKKTLNIVIIKSYLVLIKINISKELF